MFAKQADLRLNLRRLSVKKLNIEQFSIEHNENNDEDNDTNNLIVDEWIQNLLQSIENRRITMMSNDVFFEVEITTTSADIHIIDQLIYWTRWDIKTILNMILNCRLKQNAALRIVE